MQGQGVKEQSLTGLIEAIYTTVLAPQAWSGVLECIHQEIGLDGWSLLHVRDQVKVCAVGGERANAAAAQRYEAYYGAIDPRAAHVRGTPVGMVCADQNLFDDLGAHGDGRHEPGHQRQSQDEG